MQDRSLLAAALTWPGPLADEVEVRRMSHALVTCTSVAALTLFVVFVVVLVTA